MKGYFVSSKKNPLITERSVKSLPFYVLKDSLSVVISLDRSIPTIFQQFSLSSTVHNVHVEDCPLCPVLFGIVAIMLDMVMVMVVMDNGHGPDNGHVIRDGAAYCNVQL